MDPPATSWDRRLEAIPSPSLPSRISQEGHRELAEKGVLSSQRGRAEKPEGRPATAADTAVLGNDAAASGQGERTGGGQSQVDTQAPGRQG